MAHHARCAYGSFQAQSARSQSNSESVLWVGTARSRIGGRLTAKPLQARRRELRTWSLSCDRDPPSGA